MMNIYGQDAEHETRKYAEMLKDRGSRQYAIWVEAADIIARRQKLLKTLDALSGADMVKTNTAEWYLAKAAPSTEAPSYQYFRRQHL